MKPLWTGAIGFGLVNIPIKLYSAARDSSLDLDMIDKRDHSNIHYLKVNEKSGKEVRKEDIVKGFKVNGQYVVLTDKDFEAASAEKTKLIEISEFVNLNEIDTMFYESPFFVAPGSSGERAYALLREALHKTGKAAVASFVMRNKESLAVLRATEDVIILNRIRFKQEILSPKELKLPPKKDIKPTELKMALALIAQLSKKFNISQYKDNYAEQLMKIIRAKSKGVKTKAPQMHVVHSNATDLMSQLKASLRSKTKQAS